MSSQKFILRGGLIGRTASGSNVINCYAIGNVQARAYAAGGLIGDANSSIENCYATGLVTTGDLSGGLVGRTTSIINNSFSTGNVTGNTRVGGLVGESSFSINNSYAMGYVTGFVDYIGGLVGRVNNQTNTLTISNSVSYSKVTGATVNTTGRFIGGATLTADGITFGTLNIINCQSIHQDINSIGSVSKPWALVIPDYDMSTLLAGISDVKILDTSTNLQVGVHGNDSSRINFNTNFKFDLSAFEEGISSDSAFSAIDDFINLLSEKQTELGSVSNRLDSVLDEISIQYENLVSSRSTIRDADIAKVSSQYIQQQILQQAAATLMATANQSPAIALQLI